MNEASFPPNRRILIVDDSRAIHDDFRKILSRKKEDSTVRSEEEELFGAQPESLTANFELDSAFQGQEGLQKVEKALAEKRPYALIFLDIRMPPGWDGIETAQRILPTDPDVQIVFCTAYSDYSWGETVAKLGRSDRLVILKKPFDNIEVLQLAESLTRKWALAEQNRRQLVQLNSLVNATMRDLRAMTSVAENAASSRSTFLTAVSSELRAPTLDIIALAHALLDSDLQPQQREQAEKILSTANASLRMLTGIAAGSAPS